MFGKTAIMGVGFFFKEDFRRGLYKKTFMTAVVLGMLISLTAAPVFATDPVPSADIQQVLVPGTEPLDASAVDLAAYGYEEQEYYAFGTANRYRITNPLDTAALIDSGWPYETRIIVRKPSNPKHFNGTVVVEWYNVSTGQDIDFCWAGTYDYLMREGYVWVGVSAQRVGIKMLNVWSPARYATLTAEASNDDPLGGLVDPAQPGQSGGDVLSWDIFAQVGAALFNHHGPDDPLAGMDIRHLIAAGESQSAFRLTRYYNSIQPLHNLFEGFVFYDTAAITRGDIEVPVIRVESEIFANSVVRTDTPFVRGWQVAGATHVSFQEIGGYVDVETLRDGFFKLPDGTPVSLTEVIQDCQRYPLWSTVRTELVLNAAFDKVNTWIEDGTAAPAAPYYERNADGTIKRDANGMVLGGIRLPDFVVPTALNITMNTGPGFCFLTGSHHYYSPAELKTLYSSHGGYVEKVVQATQKVLKDGFILRYDAQQIIKQAAISDVGR
jgi:hypothetical protein